jgi:hypothetical protein
MQIRRWYWLIVAALLLLILAFSIPGSRNTILRSAGQLLVVSRSSVKSADVIVVAIDAQSGGTLEAADLVHAGVSRRVAVFDDPPTAADLEFIRRGLPYDDRAAISTYQLHLLGIQNVEQIPRKTSGSEEEGDILPAWCAQHGYRAVVLVASADHSRRLSRILRRSDRRSGIETTVVSSPYSSFSPDSWWTSRAGVRTGIVEFEKLLLDWVRHPFS